LWPTRYSLLAGLGYVQYYDDLNHLLAGPKNVADVATVRERDTATTDDGAMYYYVASAADATNNNHDNSRRRMVGDWFRSMATGAGGGLADIEVANTIYVDPPTVMMLRRARGRQDCRS